MDASSSEKLIKGLFYKFQSQVSARNAKKPKNIIFVKSIMG